jgi:hypothetical protein
MMRTPSVPSVCGARPRRARPALRAIRRSCETTRPAALERREIDAAQTVGELGSAVGQIAIPACAHRGEQPLRERTVIAPGVQLRQHR